MQRDRIITGLERDAFVLAGRSEEALETPTAESIAVITEVAKRYQASSGARVIVVDAKGIAVVTSDPDDSKMGPSSSPRPGVGRRSRERSLRERATPERSSRSCST